jgi:hypothetical protein
MSGGGRYLSQSSNASRREVLPLISLSWKNMSSAVTKQATLNVLSISNAFGINSLSYFFLFLDAV